MIVRSRTRLLSNPQARGLISTTFLTGDVALQLFQVSLDAHHPEVPVVPTVFRLAPTTLKVPMLIMVAVGAVWKRRRVRGWRMWLESEICDAMPMIPRYFEVFTGFLYYKLYYKL